MNKVMANNIAGGLTLQGFSESEIKLIFQEAESSKDINSVSKKFKKIVFKIRLLLKMVTK